MSRTPFRLEPHAGLPAPTGEARAGEAARRERRQRDIESRGPEAARAIRGLMHADERVRLDNITSAAVADVGDAGAELLIQLAIDEAAGTWTPTLDTLAVLGLLKARADEVATAALQEWVATREDAAELSDLLRFRAPAVARVVAGHSRGLTADQVARLVGAPGCLALLLANPAVRPEDREAVGARFAACYRAGERWRVGRDLESCLRRRLPLPESAREVLWQAATSRNHRLAAVQAEVRALARDVGTSTDQLLGMLPRADDPARASMLFHPAAADRKVVDEILGRPQKMRLALLALELSVESGSPLPEPVAAAFLRLPELPGSVAAQFARMEAVRGYASAWDAVLESGSGPIAMQFLPYADAARFTELFPLVARHDPARAVELLEGRPAGTALDTVDLAPLFLADPKIAARAFAQIGSFNRTPARRPAASR
jgi:hypothetical protein